MKCKRYEGLSKWLTVIRLYFIGIVGTRLCPTQATIATKEYSITKVGESAIQIDFLQGSCQVPVAYLRELLYQKLRTQEESLGNCVGVSYP